jgi:zinc/manganese transport system substrate-binding protein
MQYQDMKNQIKKIIFVLLMTVFSSVHATINIFACEPEWAALAEEIGGDRLTVYSATTSMQDPHHIQARPSLIAKARRADLLVCSGAELEIGWLPLLLRKAGNASIQPGRPGNFAAADYVEKQDVPRKLDRSMGDVHAEGNPHIHTSPENILLVAAALHKRLAEIDAENERYYLARYQAFEKQWKQLMSQWKEQASVLQGANIVTHHNYWTYLNRWSGMNVLATLEPVPGVSPSSSHLAKIKKQLSKQKIKMILHVSYVNDRPTQWLSEQTGTPVVTLPATVDYQGGQTLSQWFEKVVQQLVRVR